MKVNFTVALRRGLRGRLLARLSSNARVGERLIPITLNVPEQLFVVESRRVVIDVPAGEPITGTAEPPKDTP